MLCPLPLSPPAPAGSAGQRGSAALPRCCCCTGGRIPPPFACLSAAVWRCVWCQRQHRPQLASFSEDRGCVTQLARCIATPAAQLSTQLAGRSHQRAQQGQRADRAGQRAQRAQHGWRPAAQRQRGKRSASHHVSAGHTVEGHVGHPFCGAAAAAARGSGRIRRGMFYCFMVCCRVVAGLRGACVVQL